MNSEIEHFFGKSNTIISLRLLTARGCAMDMRYQWQKKKWKKKYSFGYEIQQHHPSTGLFIYTQLHTYLRIFSSSVVFVCMWHSSPWFAWQHFMLKGGIFTCRFLWWKDSFHTHTYIHIYTHVMNVWVLVVNICNPNVKYTNMIK